VIVDSVLLLGKKKLVSLKVRAKKHDIEKIEMFSSVVLA